MIEWQHNIHVPSARPVQSEQIGTYIPGRAYPLSTSSTLVHSQFMGPPTSYDVSKNHVHNWYRHVIIFCPVASQISR